MKNTLTKILNVLNGLNTHPLTKNNLSFKFSVLKRMIYWQIMKNNKYRNGKVIPWVNGRKLIIYPGRASESKDF